MNNLHTIASGKLSLKEQEILKGIARDAIKYGLEHSSHLPVKINDYPSTLSEPGASFVTLKKSTQLRGCIGSLEAQRPLAEGVAHNAYAAAFLDHRFAPLSVKELPEIELHISVLSVPEPISFDNEDDLVAQIIPGVDGLILEDGVHRGTFLPSVWESLSDAASFLQHLKQKAGLPADYWSPSLKVFRYTSESF